jgi:hypothetical protein
MIAIILASLPAEARAAPWQRRAISPDTGGDVHCVGGGPLQSLRDIGSALLHKGQAATCGHTDCRDFPARLN